MSGFSFKVFSLAYVTSFDEARAPLLFVCLLRCLPSGSCACAAACGTLYLAAVACSLHVCSVSFSHTI